MVKGKRGWIRIVEAFVAVLLIGGVLLFMINQGYIGKADISEQVYQAQLAVLREIELDGGLRTQILLSPLVEGKTNEYEVPTDVEQKIIERIPDYLECDYTKICDLDIVCEIEEIIEKDVYAQAVAIVAEKDQYSPRQVKLFCWTR